MSVMQEAASIEAAGSDPASALVGLVMLVGGLILTPLAVVLGRMILPERRVFFARWRFSHLVQVVLVALVAMVLVGSAAAAFDASAARTMSSTLGISPGSGPLAHAESADA